MTATPSLVLALLAAESATASYDQVTFVGALIAGIVACAVALAYVFRLLLGKFTSARDAQSVVEEKRTADAEKHAGNLAALVKDSTAGSVAVAQELAGLKAAIDGLSHRAGNLEQRLMALEVKLK